MSKRRKQHWSILLVGDHGHTIRLRWFKGMVISLLLLALLGTGALATMTVLYLRQTQDVDALRSQCQTQQIQTGKLRDERDILLAQVVIRQQQNAIAATPDLKKVVQPTKADALANSPASSSSSAAFEVGPKLEQVPAPQPAEPQPGDASRGVTVKNFEANYNSDRKGLEAQFRICNTSNPKKTVAGQAVVIFKHTGDPPAAWVTSPEVALVDGRPNGLSGQTFKVNNYLTVDFKTPPLKDPVRPNAASIFIFTDQGDLLFTQDYPLDVTYPFPTQSKS